MLGDTAVYRVQRRGHDVDAKHHAGPAAVRLVVHLTRAERCRVAVVEDPEIELGAEHGRDRPALANPVESGRNEREDVEAHRQSRLPVVRESGCDHNSPLRELNLANAVLDEGQEQAAVELEDVVRDAGDHAHDGSEPRAVLAEGLEPDEVTDVVRALVRRR